MKKFLLLVCCLSLFLGGQVSAKEKKWVDESVDFSTWKRVILLDLKNGETKDFDGKIGYVSPELVKNSSSTSIGYVSPDLITNSPSASGNGDVKKEVAPNPPVEVVVKPEEPEKSAFAKAMEEKPAEATKVKEDGTDTIAAQLTGFDAAQAQWKEQAQKKLGKKVQFISFTECVAYLQAQAPEIDWKKEWKERDFRVFWEMAGPYLKDYADGILYGELHSYGESTVYIPPSTRSVRIQQGGTFRNGTYHPNYVTQYYKTGGYDEPSWNAYATFGLVKVDGTPCWTYDKYSNKAKAAWFRSSSEEQYFSSFFARGFSEVPFSGEKPKPDPDERG